MATDLTLHYANFAPLNVWNFWGRADDQVVKVLDSQPRDSGFESRHTIGLLCLKSLGKICTPNVP